MAPQLLFVDTSTGRVQAGNADTRAPLVIALLGTELVLTVAFVDEAVPGELPSGTTGRLVLKAADDHAGDVVLQDAAWTSSGAAAARRYTFSLLADSEPLRTLIEGKARIELGAQIEWQVTGEDAPRKSQPFAVHLVNSYARPEDGAPDVAADAAFAWLVARLVAGGNVTLTVDSEARTITLAATGGGGGSASWGSIGGTLSAQTDLDAALAGKAAATHTHTISALPVASGAEAVAGVSNTKVMTPERTAQAIAALAPGGAGATIVTPSVAYVELTTGNDETGIIGRPDAPFATIAAAIAAQSPPGPLGIVLGVGAHAGFSLTRSLTVLRITSRCPGEYTSVGNITITGPAGTAAEYENGWTSGNGSNAELILESDGSVRFADITVTGGAGGIGGPDPETDPSGRGGDFIVALRGVIADTLTLSPGAEVAQPVTNEVAARLVLERCEITAVVLTSSGQAYAADLVPNSVQISHSTVASIAVDATWDNDPLGWAKCSIIDHLDGGNAVVTPSACATYT